jgi:hypothetical protein
MIPLARKRADSRCARGITMFIVDDGRSAGYSFLFPMLSSKVGTVRLNDARFGLRYSAVFLLLNSLFSLAIIAVVGSSAMGPVGVGFGAYVILRSRLQPRVPIDVEHIRRVTTAPVMIWADHISFCSAFVMIGTLWGPRMPEPLQWTGPLITSVFLACSLLPFVRLLIPSIRPRQER